MYASTEAEHRELRRQLARLVLPAIAERRRAGAGLGMLATAYGCSTKWLNNRLVESELPLDRDESKLLGLPRSWEPIPIPDRQAVPGR
ncbi:hypothetical protein [Kitasatospora griseola]|uniref:hypothetical protein n=1 Tax=Kitasatospora griseola TaxID=2064 RepID=UPI0038044CD8